MLLAYSYSKNERKLVWNVVARRLKKIWARVCCERESSETALAMKMNLGTELYDPACLCVWKTVCGGTEKTLSTFK